VSEQAEPEEEISDNGESASYHNSRNSLDWGGVYQGIIPSASGMGIAVQLILHYDETYLLTYEYLIDSAEIPEIGNFGWGKENPETYESGSFEWDEDGSIIRLDITNMPPYFHVGEGRLTQLDMSGEFITGNLSDSYILTKVAEVGQ